MNKPLPDYRDQDFTRESLGQPRYLGLVQTLLDTNFDVRFTVTGQSMRPFLKGDETITLRKQSPEKLRIGDLIFFLDNQKKPILHRIVKKKSDNSKVTFFTKGDALSYLDEPITAENILGKVTRIERAGRKAPINITAPGWIPINYIIAWTSRVQIHCNRIALLPGLHKRLASPIFRFIVIIATGTVLIKMLMRSSSVIFSRSWL